MATETSTKTRPRIIVESDGLCTGTRIMLDDGTDISRYVTRVEWDMDCNAGVAYAKLHVFAVGGEMPAELDGLTVTQHIAERHGQHPLRGLRYLFNLITRRSP